MIQQDYLPTIGPAIEKLGFDVGVVGGGSYAYKCSSYKSFDEVRDIDILLIFKTREKMLDFIVEHQPDLDVVLKIPRPAKHFTKEELKPLSEGYVDSVRYSGTNILGQKISVKILSYDHLIKVLSQSEIGRINVLSKKDRRFYRYNGLDGHSGCYGIINQKTPDSLTILGDLDLFPAGSCYSLGIITNLFISGKFLYNSPVIDLGRIMDLLINKTGRFALSSMGSYPSNWSSILTKEKKMPEEFKQEFNNRILKYLVKEKVKEKVGDKKPSASSDYNIYIVSPIIPKPHTQILLKSPKKHIITQYRYIKSSGPFSSNSYYGLALFDDGKTAFFKEMLNEFRFRAEIYGLITASAYYGHLQKPIYMDPERNLVTYPWFSGDILARKRLCEITDEMLDWLMEIELRRAEDNLNAYLLSANDIHHGRIPLDGVYRSRIHDLFYGRLAGDRLKKFYEGYSVDVAGISLTFNELMNLIPIVNGTTYPPLAVSIKKATEHLNPERLRSKLLVCGLGDSHSGNIMVGERIEDYLYIDYEFAGFHSPYLDLAKAIYNDCAFGIFYIDLFPSQKFDVKIEISDNQLVINHSYQPDRLSRFMLRTKIEGVLLPVRDYLKKRKVPVDDDWLDTIGYAMLCCGLYTRNLTNMGKEGFFLNLANTIEAASFATYYQKSISRTVI